MSTLIILSVLSAVTMLYALWSVLALKKNVPGGLIGKKLNGLVALVILFSISYIMVPFLGQLSQETLTISMNIILLFGAIYVVATISLIKRIIQTLSD